MIELRAGRLRCELEPEQGGAVTGLWRDGDAVLHADGVRPLVPYSNRIAHAAVVWQGTQQPQVRHTGDPPASIQGLAWRRPWSVLDADEASAMLAFEHRSEASWPFAFDCSHTVRLRPSGLELTLALTNQSAQPAPAGLAWRIALPRWPGARVDLGAAARCEFDADQLPVRRSADPGLASALEGLPAERCFEGWDGSVRLRGGPVPLALRSGLARLCVGLLDDTLLLVPASHAPNAVHLYASGASAADLGLVLLQPGESLLAQVTLATEEGA
jgi:aldose 1-epimerase